MNKYKSFLVLSFMLCFINVTSQNPKPVLQKPFEGGIEDIKISPDKSHFITLEGDAKSIGGFDIKLWDYNSKIIIAQHHFEGENGPGSGKLKLLNNGEIVYSTNHSIKKLNLIKKVEEDIFKVEWPEYIHDYTSYTPSNFIVSTKIYSNNAETIDEITNQSALYILEGEIIKAKKENEFEIPTISFDSISQNILAGTNKGDVFFYDLNLIQVREKRSFFKNKAISFIHLTPEGYVIASPALPTESKGYTTEVSLGIFKILNNNDDSFSKTIELPKQKSPKKEDKYAVFKFNPSNMIKDVIVKNNVTLVVSYGYNKIDFLDLNNFELIEKGPQDVAYDIKKIYLNPNSDEILYSYGPISMGSTAINLSIYNTNFEKNIFVFKQKLEVLERTKSLKQIGENYYFTELLNTNSLNDGNDSITIQSPIYQDVKSVNCKKCEIYFNQHNDSWLIKDFNDNLFIGVPTNSLIKTNSNELSFSYDYDSDTSVFNQEKLFNNTKHLKLTKTHKKYFDPDLIAYFKHSNTLLAGLRKKNSDYFLAILNSDGSIKKLFGEKYNYSYRISDDGKYFGLSSESGRKKITVEVYETSNWEQIISYETEGWYKPDLFFDTSNKFIFFQNERLDTDGVETYALQEIELSKGIGSITEIHQGEFYNNFFVDRTNKFIYLSDSDYIKKINYETKKTLFQKAGGFATHQSYFSRENNKIVVDAGEYVSFFDMDTNASASFYFFPENQYIGITNEGYYMTTPKFPLENFGFVINSNGYSFSQFDMVYNRPDKVLEFLKFPTQEQVTLFKSAYKKRLVHQNIEIEAISNNISKLPKLKINLTNTNFSTQQRDYVINASFNDPIHSLKSYNVWVNGVSVFGSRGKSIKTNLTTLEEQILLQLSRGKNKIEISCTNEKGLESLRKSVTIFYDAKKEKGDLIFVGIGVSKYQDNTYNLTYASKDVKDMSTYMQSLKSNYNSVDIITLLDEEVTIENVKAIKQQLKNTTIEDKVVVFYAGHGLLDESYNYFIATHNINFDNPIENGLPYSELEGLLDNIPARQKLLLIDACHSGEIDKESVTAIETYFDSSHIKLGFRGSKAITVGDKKIQNAFELMQRAFSDLRFGNGATVISSSSGLEFAYEGEEWKNGVFTYALLEGLKSGNADTNNDDVVTISEIITYVSKKVNTLTNGKQKPNARTVNLEWDWGLE